MEKFERQGALQFTKEGVIYQGKLYKMSKTDMEWVKKQNKKEPFRHPARDLRSLAHQIVDLD